MDNNDPTTLVRSVKQFRAMLYLLDNGDGKHSGFHPFPVSPMLTDAQLEGFVGQSMVTALRGIYAFVDDARLHRNSVNANPGGRRSFADDEAFGRVVAEIEKANGKRGAIKVALSKVHQDTPLVDPDEPRNDLEKALRDWFDRQRAKRAERTA